MSFCCLRWALYDIRKQRKRKQQEKEIALYALENQRQELQEDGLPFTSFDIGARFIKKPIINSIIQIWSYFEILLMVVVLCTRKEKLNRDVYNLLYNGKCDTNIMYAALWRIPTTIFLLIGSNKVSTNGLYTSLDMSFELCFTNKLIQFIEYCTPHGAVDDHQHIGYSSYLECGAVCIL